MGDFESFQIGLFMRSKRYQNQVFDTFNIKCAQCWILLKFSTIIDYHSFICDQTIEQSLELSKVTWFYGNRKRICAIISLNAYC